MGKMMVSYEKRFGVNCDPNKFRILLVCRDAYDCKDALKEMGFAWNSFGKSWEKETTDEAFMTELVKIVVACKKTYNDFCYYWQFLPEAVRAASIDAEAMAAFNDYMGAHPEWF